MTAAALRRQLKKTIDRLPSEKLRSAADFVEYLSSQVDGLSEDDRRKIAGMKKRIAKAERDIAAGRMTPVENLRRKY
jgi:hypothetical protein